MKYDEYQLFTRYRLGYHTMFLTEILIVVNILLCMRRPWASTMVQMTALLIFPGLYFITGAVFRNAYLEIGARHWVHGLCSMGIGLLGILVFTVSDPVLLQDGMVWGPGPPNRRRPRGPGATPAAEAGRPNKKGKKRRKAAFILFGEQAVSRVLSGRERAVGDHLSRPIVAEGLKRLSRA